MYCVIIAHGQVKWMTGILQGMGGEIEIQCYKGPDKWYNLI